MANLAKIILEGSDQVPSVDLGNFDYSDTAITESSYSDAAVATLFSDIMEAEQGYMVADVVGAATVIRESANGNQVDPVAVSESVIKNGIAKIKVAFQKFIAKIKEYYKRVIDWFKAMFSNGEDFAKNYGDKIKKKAAKVKEFHYTGYKYNTEAGGTRVTEIKDKVNTKMQKLIGGYDFVKESLTTQEFRQKLRDSKAISNTFKDDDKPTSTEVVDKFISEELKASDISDLRTTLIETYRDGDDKKSDIKDFEANSVDSMISFLKSSKKTISEFEKQLKNYEEKTNKVISKLNGFESIKDEEGGSNLVSNASYISGIMTAYLNLYKVPCEVQIAIYKAMSSEFLGALKKFYNFKGNAVKESTEVFDAEAFATLENALVLEGCGSNDVEEGCGSKKIEEGCGGKGCDSDDDDEKECATESAIAGILEQATAYTF